jgi:pyridoxal phosphate enzyme (YggS family)
MAAMSPQCEALKQVLQTLDNAAVAGKRPAARLLAVSKTRPPAAVRALAEAGQRAFGENYVQEGVAKILALADLGLEWHLIGHLQSNKCREAAEHFDWVQSLDRAKLVQALAQHRPERLPPLNVLVQVNADGEPGKSGCAPEEIDTLARAVAASPRLRLRGLMAIPEPTPDLELRRHTFRRLREWFDALRLEFPDIDTLSMGMSEDYLLAVEEGATMVRIGSALFGARA